MVVAFPAGGFADVTGRIFAEEMSKVLNTPIAPINKGGATGSLAATSMLSAAKDGYSILVNTLGGMVLAPVTLKDIKYDTNKDFYPVAFITSAPDGLTVRAESPYQKSQRPDRRSEKEPEQIVLRNGGHRRRRPLQFSDPLPGHRHQDQTCSVQRRWRIHSGALGRASGFRHRHRDRDPTAGKRRQAQNLGAHGRQQNAGIALGSDHRRAGHQRKLPRQLVRRLRHRRHAQAGHRYARRPPPRK